MADKEFSEFAINELASMNIIDKDDVLDFHREKIKKAYPAYFDTYEHIDEIVNYLNTFSKTRHNTNKTVNNTPTSTPMHPQKNRWRSARG